MINLDKFKLEYYEVDSSKYPYSRYRNLDWCKDEDGMYFIETYEHLEIPETNRDKYHEVSSGEKNRLDLIAYRYYKNPALWWIIAEANNIIDPSIVEVGRVLRIPSRETVFGYGGVLG